MCPVVVPISGVGWLCAGNFVDIVQGGSKFGNILESFNYLKLTSRESQVSVLLVAVRVATVAQLLAVAVERLEMASTVSCW